MNVVRTYRLAARVDWKALDGTISLAGFLAQLLEIQ